jgi:7-carboxy-7-deazaguanine synthase
MSYAVKEIFYSLQGEGARAGRAAVFLRFAGCNLQCDFCDTDFSGTDGPLGGRYAEAEILAATVASLWPKGGRAQPYVVCTGGEPLLQLDAVLIAALHERSFEIAVETNGTLAVPAGIEWICVSPKVGAALKQTSGRELKLVFPQPGVQPETFAALSFDHYFLQPMDGPARADNTAAAIRYCLSHPQWRLGLQMHKLVGIK